MLLTILLTGPPPHRFITLPNNSSHSTINNLNKFDIKITFLPSKTIRELVHSSPQRNIFSDAGVYCISFKNCKLKYIGEKFHNLHVRLKEHKRDIRIGSLNNALFQYISQWKLVKLFSSKSIFKFHF